MFASGILIEQAADAAQPAELPESTELVGRNNFHRLHQFRIDEKNGTNENDDCYGCDAQLKSLKSLHDDSESVSQGHSSLAYSDPSYNYSRKSPEMRQLRIHVH